MKWIYYKIQIPSKDDKVTLSNVQLSYSEENEEIAKKESYNGEYTIEDDGIEETAYPTQEQRITELEEAMELLLSGATE